MDLYRPAAVSGPMLAGSLVHRGLEAFHEGLTYKNALIMMYESTVGWHEFDVQKHGTIVPGDVFDYIGDVSYWESEEGRINFSKCKAYVAGYYKRYQSQLEDIQDAKVRWLVEQEFNFKIDTKHGEITIRGKLDAVTGGSELPVILEHKTTSLSLESVTGTYFARLPMDIQCTIYREAGWRLGNGFPTLVYDVVGTSKASPKQKKKIAKRKSETDDEYAERKAENQESLEEFDERIMEYYLEHPEKYIRYEVICTEDQHNERLGELKTFMELLEEGKKQYGPDSSSLFNMRNSSACFNFGGCDYLNVCIGRESLESSEKLIQIENSHPELTASQDTTLHLEKRR
tara:strand:- start:5636 stop:6667 length:1032 start_codon:yes stop_codon:yes gene_type:complete